MDLPPNGEPLNPSPLPPELAEFLKDQPVACLLHETDRGTVFVIKVPARDIESVRGRVPIHLRHELYDHPASPVIRTVLTVYDDPDRPLALETFTNIQDPRQKSDFAAIASQKTVIMLFYDETLTHRLTKAVGQGLNEPILEVLHHAEQMLAQIPKEKFDFDRAKAAVMKRTTV